jgi:ribosomal-protein-alanine N-acetyltransferase
MGVETTIREAGAEDFEAIFALEHACVGAPHWSAAIWRRLLAGRGSLPLRIVMVGALVEEIVGFIVVSGTVEAVELESVAVSEAWRGQGIGAELCRAAMRWAEEQGAAKMELEVRASNAAARAMYGSLGFVEQGVRARYYRAPEEDAVLMMAALGPWKGVERGERKV